MSLKFSVGCAVFDQPDFWESLRVEFTVQHLDIFHHDHVGEIIVVDNNPLPGSPLRELPDKVGGHVRYVEMPAPVGTSAPRNRVFQEAKFDHVVCVDPHVMLYPGTFDAVEKFYDEHGHDSPDILHAWLYTERYGSLYATHMNDQWREEMLGTWGWGWRPSPGHLAAGAPDYFSVVDPGDHVCRFVSLDGDEQRDLTPAEISALGLPPGLSIYGHERLLHDMGFRQPSEPFKIPGHGMWFWACRKDAWLPFHDKCRGFGGEEITTGKRFRKAGRSAWSLPGAGGWHHFGRRGGRVPYRLTAYDKIRNYCLEFQRLGLPLTPIAAHFAGRGKLATNEWEAAVRGDEWPSRVQPGQPRTAEEMTERQMAEGGVVAVRANQPRTEEVRPVVAPHQPQPALPGGIDELYKAAVHAPSPINADLPHLRHLAADCGPDACVLEIAHQSVSIIALAAGGPKRLVSYGGAPPHRVESVRVNARSVVVESHGGVPSDSELPQKYDLLFLDVSPHTSVYYYQLLNRLHHRCTRYVAVHDTVAYGEYWNDAPGLLPGIRQFLKEHPEWHEVAHSKAQNGLMVLSRRPGDKDNALARPEELAEVQAPQPARGATPPAEGVGTELKNILSSLGINPNAGCDCNGKVAAMNTAGADWCEQNVNTIVGWLRDGAPRWGWTDWVRAGAHAVKNGIAFKVNPLDPFPGLVNEAIARYKAKAGQTKESA